MRVSTAYCLLSSRLGQTDIERKRLKTRHAESSRITIVSSSFIESTIYQQLKKERWYLAIEDNIWGRGWPLHSPTFLVIHLVHVNLKKKVEKLHQQCCEWYSQVGKGTVGQERESTRSSKQPSSMTTCSQGQEEGSHFSSQHPLSALFACRIWQEKGEFYIS